MVISIHWALGGGRFPGQVELAGAELKLGDALLQLDCAIGNQLLPLISSDQASIQLRPMVFVYVNGVNHRFLQGLETLVRDGDRLTVGSAFIGG